MSRWTSESGNVYFRLAFTSAGIAAIGFFPATAAGLTALSDRSSSWPAWRHVYGMACDSLIAYATPDELRGKVAGGTRPETWEAWESEAGLDWNWRSACIRPGWPVPSSELCLLCCLALFWAPKPEPAFAGCNLMRKAGGDGHRRLASDATARGRFGIDTLLSADRFRRRAVRGHRAGMARIEPHCGAW